MTEPDFYSQMRSHIGGLIRVTYRGDGSEFIVRESYPDVEVGLVLSAKPMGRSGGFLGMNIELLMGGRVQRILLFSDEVEFIGGAE